MFEVWAEWTNGQVECVDEADTKPEAGRLVGEYRMAYSTAAKRVWFQTKR